MTHNLFRELATAATGTDCDATAAWLATWFKDTDAAARACAFWDAAPERLQAAIATKLGWTEPTSERNPVHDAIMRDFHLLNDKTSEVLDFTD